MLVGCANGGGAWSNMDAIGGATDSGSVATGDDGGSPVRVDGGSPAQGDSGTQAHADGGSQTDSGIGVQTQPDSSTPIKTPVGDGSVQGKTSIAWAVDYPDDVFTTIAAHTSSFTHVAVFVYEIQDYSGGGVAPFWNTPGGADVWQNGLTSTTMAAKVHGMGLKYLAAVAGGAELNGNQGILNIITDTPAGTQAGFITSMVSEGAAKQYDGYALDLEMGGAPAGQVIDYADHGAKMESFLAAFKAALHAQGMILTVAFVPNDVKQSCTSYGNGVWDLTELGNNVDLAMLENYATTLGTASTSCPASFSEPAGCYSGTVFGPFSDEVDLLCVSMVPASINITMNAWSQMTNPFAGDATSLLQSYGVQSVGLFPQINADGPGGSYAVFESNGMAPAGTDWFSLLTTFLTH